MANISEWADKQSWTLASSMMSRLLTDEEIYEAARWYFERREDSLKRIKAVCEAQAALTLKEVGEWLEKNIVCGRSFKGIECIQFDALEEGIKVFLQGKMPGGEDGVLVRDN